MLVRLLERKGVTVLAAIDVCRSLADCVAEHAPEAVVVSADAPDARLLAQVDRLQAAGGCPIVLLSGNATSDELNPDGRYIVTATQDRDLHCWRLEDGKDYRMSGYPSKIRSIGWTASSSYLCASGADTVTSWLCDAAGPGGKPALVLGFVFNGTVMEVAPHPERDTVAAGYDDGTVLIGDIEAGDALIAKPPGGGPVSSLAWAPDGNALAVGTRGGLFTVIRLDGATV